MTKHIKYFVTGVGLFALLIAAFVTTPVWLPIIMFYNIGRDWYDPSKCHMPDSGW